MAETCVETGCFFYEGNRSKDCGLDFGQAACKICLANQINSHIGRTQVISGGESPSVLGYSADHINGAKTHMDILTKAIGAEEAEC